MQVLDGRVVYSASDLVGYLECEHLAHLERAAAMGHITRPMRSDPVLDRIAERGRAHEGRFLADLATEGVSVVEAAVEGPPTLERIVSGRDATIAAMRDGVDVVYQAVLFDGLLLGFADFLRRVERPSALGDWGYEVWDTKLARHAKASAVLQISMYSAMVAAIQGAEPQQMHLALGGVQRETVSYRVADFAAYYRLAARELEALLAGDGPVFPIATQPSPVGHCDVCRWALQCQARWRADDDLSLVAGLSGRQRRALHAVWVTTRTGLAEPTQSLPDRLEGAGREALARIRAQASIQVRGERAGHLLAERIPPARTRDGALVPDVGLLMLPEPSNGDLFFDIEGDPFFESGTLEGIDYLFGVIEPRRADASGQPGFHAFWAIEGDTVTSAGERRAFEAFIDLVIDRLATDPNLHVYHYASYETTAVKRLAGRYATREEEVDRLLRGGVFVDLFRAVRQGVRASVESYSIKRLEPLYGFERDIELRDAGSSIVEFETWLELGQDAKREDILQQIELYNRDDCVSTLRLRDWLEAQRASLENEAGEPLPRPSIPAAEETEDSLPQQAVQQLIDSLVANVPEDLTTARDHERGQWLLAQLLNWHRREAKSFWWRYFFLKDDLSDEERREEPDALGELSLLDAWRDPTPGARSTIYRFEFPPQEHKIAVGHRPHDPSTGSGVGEVVAIDEERRWIDLKASSSRPAPTPTSLIPHEYIRPQPKPESLHDLAAWVLENGIEAPGKHRAARELLMRRPPRAGQQAGASLVAQGEDASAAARRLVGALDASYLAIQGPPGSGKSTVGAQMIVDLVADGKRVGVTATSHKVIGELLEKTARAATSRGIDVAIGQRAGDEGPTYGDALHLETNEAARDGLASRTFEVVGGTAWLWARPDMADSLDVLFIDEAGQMSLADAIAAARCATSLVLLGDPQQLDQPLQGTHPAGAERSALAHVLNGEQVMPAHLGVFLDGTWRLHPKIAAYTSEVFYEGRLHARPGREVLQLNGSPPLSGVGLRFIPVLHERRSSDAPEEARAIAERVRQFLDAGSSWTDADGNLHAITDDDVLLVTPYNAQVAAIRDVLPGFRIGTVDKFQGQQAPVSIYSMATSSADEAPRGMEFLYSLNRLNVATSRAQCLAVLVASPALLLVRCRTPRQMRLANALARFVEMAAL